VNDRHELVKGVFFLLTYLHIYAHLLWTIDTSW